MDNSLQARPSLYHFCIEAFKKNLLPGLVILAVGVATAMAYYFVPAVRHYYEFVADLKNRGGFLFSAVSTMLFGGLVPFIFMVLTGRIQNDYFRLCLFFCLFWVWRGVEVDAFYRLQAYIFGHGTDWLTIVKKTFVDQFVYNIIWVAPMIIILFAWKDCGFSFAGLKKIFNKDFFAFRMPALMFSAWAVWVPTVAVIYCLPGPLQIPLFNIETCFWALMICMLANKSRT